MRVWEIIESASVGASGAGGVASVPGGLWTGPTKGQYPYVVPDRKKKKLKEFTRPGKRDDYQKILHNAGYRLIGQGGQAEVYHKPGKEYVLKIFSSRDYAYQDFLKLVMAHPNKHFPKIIGKLVKVSPSVYAVRLEPLSSLTDWEGYDAVRDYMAGRLDDEQEQWLEERPELLDALRLITSELGEHSRDLHAGNVMMRGNDLVIIDPVF